jgi:rhamnogalacturonyl hydrolase YesR
MFSHVRLLLGGTAIAIAVAACSGGSGVPPFSTPTPSATPALATPSAAPSTSAQPTLTPQQTASPTTAPPTLSPTPTPLPSATPTASASGAKNPAVLATMQKVNTYWQSHNSAGTNGWQAATYWLGDLAAYDATGVPTYLNSATSWAASFGYGLQSPLSPAVTPDTQAAGQVYIRLSQLHSSPSDLTHITAAIHALVTGSNTNPWTYVDALNMSMPNFAELGAITGDSAYDAKMFTLYSHAKSALYDSSRHLWWRDGTFAQGSVYWSRGNGWAFVALAKVLAALPPSDPNYAAYAQTFKDMAAELKSLQRSDGFWSSDLTAPGSGGPETSGTAMFTFGFAWGVNAGVLDRTTYAPVAMNAWNGMTSTAVQSSGFLGYVQPAGLAPGPAAVTDTADFGVGAFLLAGAQVAQL